MPQNCYKKDINIDINHFFKDSASFNLAIDKLFGSILNDKVQILVIERYSLRWFLRIYLFP